jgi:hypothetical protein
MRLVNPPNATVGAKHAKYRNNIADNVFFLFPYSDDDDVMMMMMMMIILMMMMMMMIMMKMVMMTMVMMMMVMMIMMMIMIIVMMMMIIVMMMIMMKMVVNVTFHDTIIPIRYIRFSRPSSLYIGHNTSTRLPSYI